jgi:hypothetical protein
MIKKYECGFCNNQFQQDVEYKGKIVAKDGSVVHSAGNKSALSTQVVCPKCNNMIPTWDRESTGKLVGRKHIHLR